MVFSKARFNPWSWLTLRVYRLNKTLYIKNNGTEINQVLEEKKYVYFAEIKMLETEPSDLLGR